MGGLIGDVDRFYIQSINDFCVSWVGYKGWRRRGSWLLVGRGGGDTALIVHEVNGRCILSICGSLASTKL